MNQKTRLRAASRVVLACSTISFSATAQIELVSTNSSGADLIGNTGTRACISEGGRYVAFDATASNAGVGSSGLHQVFVKDTQTGALELVSKTSAGGPGNNDSYIGDITPDGRYVVFWSFASNIPGDLGSNIDVFRFDRMTNSTTLISVGMNGAAGNSVSKEPRISDDGMQIAFMSAASNLVPNDTNGGSGKFDAFVRDLGTNTTERVNVSSTGAQDPTSVNALEISGDGRFVVFESGYAWFGTDTDALMDIYLKDRSTGALTFVSLEPNAHPIDYSCTKPRISRDGSSVAFESASPYFVANDSNSKVDPFVLRLATGAFECVSRSIDGVHVANGTSFLADISADGRFVSFDSAATNISPADTTTGPSDYADTYIRDTLTNRTIAVTINPLTGETAAGGSSTSTFDASGRFLAFVSNSPEFAVADLDTNFDVFRVQVAFGEHGGATVGANGKPRLTMSGDLLPASNNTLSLTKLVANSFGVLVISPNFQALPFKGALLLTGASNLITLPIAADASGEWLVPFTMPAGPLIPGAVTLQALMPDGTAFQGVAFSNAISLFIR